MELVVDKMKLILTRIEERRGERDTYPDGEQGAKIGDETPR